MPLFSAHERRLADAASELTACNPFTPERIECERRALGSRFVQSDSVWNIRVDVPDAEPNVLALRREMAAAIRAIRARLDAGDKASAAELSLYEDLVLYHLYDKLQAELVRVILQHDPGRRRTVSKGLFTRFRRELRELLRETSRDHLVADEQAAHLFALSYQVRRAFHFIFQFMAGASMPAARLRTSVWQSLFTHDMKRYRRSLYGRMRDIATLIVGASGTGKELVARAVGLSQYIPFDPASGAFVAEPEDVFIPLNVSALSAALIESELFGHRKGAFTGATTDHTGWLELCGALGSVFLDEIGEVSTEVQVKLLRVLEIRTFQRLGDTQPRQFAGKIIAATNRDLAEEMHEGRFRQDLYYRLCSDIMVTPSLREQIADAPDELGHLVFFLAKRIAGDTEADGLTNEVLDWIDRSLEADYDWPGNVRELEQCVRNVLIRREYRPPRRPGESGTDQTTQDVLTGKLTAEEVLRWYCTRVYAQTRNYSETARRVVLDRRTIKNKIDPGLV